MQNPSESQQNICRTHQNLNKTYAETVRISTKHLQSPPESQQNLCRTHQNLNKTYAELIRISTIPMQNSSELQQKNPSESPHNPCKIFEPKHTRPQPPEQQNLDHVLQPAPECRPCGPESPCSLGRSHMSYILKIVQKT